MAETASSGLPGRPDMDSHWATGRTRYELARMGLCDQPLCTPAPVRGDCATRYDIGSGEMNTVKMILWGSILALFADAVIPTIAKNDADKHCPGCEVQQEAEN